MTGYLVANSAMGFILEIAILWRAISQRFYRRYLPFYLYLTYVVAIAVFRSAVLYTAGYESRTYYYSYHVTTFPFPAFQLWVLWELYRKFGNSKKSRFPSLRLFMISTLAVVPVALSLITARAGFFDKFHALTLPFQVAFCLGVYASIGGNPRVVLGQNEKGILLGLSLLLALQSINYAYRVFEVGNYFISIFLVQFIYNLALIILAWTLWNYRPSQELDPAAAARLAGVNFRFEQLVRLFFFRR